MNKPHYILFIGLLITLLSCDYAEKQLDQEAKENNNVVIEQDILLPAPHDEEVWINTSIVGKDSCISRIVFINNKMGFYQCGGTFEADTYFSYSEDTITMYILEYSFEGDFELGTYQRNADTVSTWKFAKLNNKFVPISIMEKKENVWLEVPSDELKSRGVFKKAE